MTSLNKLSKINRKHHWGRNKFFLKTVLKLKGISMYNAKTRKSLKLELKKEM